MKIAFVTSGRFDSEATLKRATGMAGPLLAAGHTVGILLEDDPSNRKKAQLECPDAELYWHPGQLPPTEEARSKTRTLKKFRPDVIWICALGFRNWIRPYDSDQIALVDHSELFSRTDSPLLRRVAYACVEWCCLFAFHGHICASRYLAELYKKRLSAVGKNAPVLYSPYAYHLAESTEPTTSARALDGRFENKKILLYLGTFWAFYGFWEMLRAFKHLADERRDFVAILIGKGPEREAGEEWIREQNLNDIVYFEGYVPDHALPNYFEAAHAFICPLRDTIQDRARCPSKLFLYIPYNRPIATCKVGEAQEIFGEKGAYYKPGDSFSLKRCLAKILDGQHEHIVVHPEDHTYQTRTRDFLSWFRSAFGKPRERVASEVVVI